MTQHRHSTKQLTERIDALNRQIAGCQRELLGLLAELETHEAWVDDGAPDMPQWTAMSLGISRWKAERWVSAGRALATLPATAEALERGDLGIDKVVELARFAEFDDEDALVRWAQRVSSGAIRRVGDLRSHEGDGERPRAAHERWLRHRYTDEGRRWQMDAELPAADGAVVAKTLERLSLQIPIMPEEDTGAMQGARRADALVALCSARLANDDDQDRASIVVHTDLDALHDADACARIEGGPVIGGTTVQRMLCNARVQTVVEHPDGTVLGLGRLSREPSAWMMRQLRHRDDTCRFPGCDARRFTQAHHIDWWSRGGATDLDNLLLVCSFHHKLVHEHGWTIRRTDGNDVEWERPAWARPRAGPAAA